MDHKRNEQTNEQSQSRVANLRFWIKQVCLEIKVFSFLVTDTQFYRRLCQFINWSISPSVCHARVKKAQTSISDSANVASTHNNIVILHIQGPFVVPWEHWLQLFLRTILNHFIITFSSFQVHEMGMSILSLCLTVFARIFFYLFRCVLASL